jgi:hypothetical protein
MSWRLVKAFAAAGLMPVLVACIAAILWSLLTNRTIGAMARFALPVTLVVSIPMAIAATLLIAVPAHVIARRLKRTSCRFYVIGGTVVSLILAILCILDFHRVPPADYEEWISNALTIAIALISGPLAAFVLWSIARPDQVPELGR